MLDLSAFSRAAAFGAFAISTIAFSGSAAAAPQNPPFPFFFLPPPMQQQDVMAPPAVEDATPSITAPNPAVAFCVDVEAGQISVNRLHKI